MKLNTTTRPLSSNSVKQAQSPAYRSQSHPDLPDYDDANRMTLDELNKELDKNINEIIQLFNRRRSLIMNKKRKLKEEYLVYIAELKRYQSEDLHADLSRTQDDQLIQSLVQQKNLHKMNRVLQSVINASAQERKHAELARSQEFWNYNKTFEAEIDQMLKKLRTFDAKLDHDNQEIHETCRTLDTIDDSIRDLLVTKIDDNVHKAEPLFANKQRQQSILNTLLQQRNKLKDEKMALIYRIIEELGRLRGLREERINKLNVIFCDDDNTNSNINPQETRLQSYHDFLEQLENMARMRDLINQLEAQEAGIVNELERVSKENDLIFNDMIRKQSEEAKLFNEWTDNLKRRLKYIKGIEYFHAQVQIADFTDKIQPIMNRFKENIEIMKPLVEEDQTIKVGLIKTNETIQTFKSIIMAIQNEKERRRELLNILENCSRLRLEEDHKTEQLRNVELEINKKTQQKRNLEEDLDAVLGDADLNTFKKIEQMLQNFDVEVNNLKQQLKRIQLEIEDINSNVIQQIARIKTDYDDILKEILPQNWMHTYDLKKLSDLKHMKNYLKKTFKRFGIMSTAFDCSICSQLALDIQSCHSCGIMYCMNCLQSFCHPEPLFCVQCFSKNIGPPEQTLKQEYQNILTKSQLIIKSSESINKPCKNAQLCQKNVSIRYKDQDVCSAECLIYSSIEMYIDKKDYASIRNTLKNIVLPTPTPDGNFKFDLFGNSIQIGKDSVQLKEEEYIFKSAIASKGFTSGVHYWEIKPLELTKNEMKIGVSLTIKFDMNSAFSDYDTGFAYYTTGSFRNGSNSNGRKYGIAFRNKGTLGVFLDMNRGVLAYSYEGEYLGEAVQSPKLTKGPIYPAVALLHHAGFTYRYIPVSPNLLKLFNS